MNTKTIYKFNYLFVNDRFIPKLTYKMIKLN